MVVGFRSEAAWQSTPTSSKIIAAQRLSSTSEVQARAGSPFCGVLDALGPPCLTAGVDQ